jgi:hypothetical protein
MTTHDTGHGADLDTGHDTDRITGRTGTRRHEPRETMSPWRPRGTTVRSTTHPH